MNVDLNTLSYDDQKRVEKFIAEAQAKESYNTFSTVVTSCFKDCITDFTSSALSTKENKCIDLCLTKFLKASQRINKRFAEENMKIQESMNQ